MEYSIVAILALLILLIINYDILKTKVNRAAYRAYRRFLIAVAAYFITDSFWGLLYESKLIAAVYADTVVYYIAMAAAVFLWTQAVIAYLNENNAFTRALYYAGWIHMFFDIITLIINFFIPIKFYFDKDGTYHACTIRYIALFIQILLFLVTSLYILIFSSHPDNKIRHRHFTIGAFGIVMSLLIILQTVYPLLPLYSIGYLLGTCIVHTFILERQKEDYHKELEELISRDKSQQMELGSTRQLVYTDILTGVKSKYAYMEAKLKIDERISNGELKEFAIVVLDLNNLKTINDTQGHDAGDNYIKESCSIICHQFQHSPVFRIGGDEFVVLLEGEDFANRKELLEAFETQMEENMRNGRAVISSGMDEYKPEENDSFSTIFERADKKMYDRKRILKETKNQPPELSV